MKGDIFALVIITTVERREKEEKMVLSSNYQKGGCNLTKEEICDFCIISFIIIRDYVLQVHVHIRIFLLMLRCSFVNSSLII